MKYIFFGTPHLATIVLDELEKARLLPSLVVTAPDKPAGRGMRLRESPVKQWAKERNISTLEPEAFDEATLARLQEENAHVCVLVAYGKILPQSVIDLTPHGIVNVHPSLLPKLRGPSPVRTAILEDHKTVGVSLMLIDEKMDHGPILMQEEYTPELWPPNAEELEAHLFARGGELLGTVLPEYLAGRITPMPQNDADATYCTLFKKEDGLLNLNDDPYTNLLKIHAYTPWPGAYYFEDDGTRVIITKAHIENSALMLDEVKPEGRRAMPYADYMRSR